MRIVFFRFVFFWIHQMCTISKKAKRAPNLNYSNWIYIVVILFWLPHLITIYNILLYHNNICILLDLLFTSNILINFKSQKIGFIFFTMKYLFFDAFIFIDNKIHLIQSLFIHPPVQCKRYKSSKMVVITSRW